MRILLLFLFLIFVPLAGAQTRDDSFGEIPELDRLTVIPNTTPSRDTAAWREVSPLPLTAVRPVFRADASQRTDIRVAYDDTYLYVSAVLYESDPSLIRMNSLQRDVWRGDDALHLHLDTFNDNETGYWFWVTPAGTKGESIVAQDGEGEGATSSAWNTLWDAQTRITSEGWTAEIRIPLRNLSFQSDGGVTTIGVTACRLIARTNELLVWPEVDPRWMHHKPSRAQDVTLRIPAQERVAHITPYVAAGASRTALAPGMGHETDGTRDAGFDVKMNLTRNLTLDLTANTDFAQVEADDQQINFTEFSLFFPEKRQFFMERAGVFDFQMDRGSRLFHGRRIGLDDAGNPVPILAGAKLVGRVGLWDVGGFNVQTRSQGVVAAENFGVLRLRRRVFNPYSNLGVLATTRLGGDRSQLDWGVDGVFRVHRDDYLTLKASETMDAEDPSLSLDRSNLYFQWQRRAYSGLRYTLQLGRIGSAWNPGVGFVGQRNVFSGMGLLMYNILTEDHPWLRSIQPSLVFIRRYRLEDGGLERNYVGPWVEFTTKRGDSGWIEPRFYWQDQQFAFSIADDVSIPVGRYRWWDVDFYYRASTGRRMRSDAEFEVGGFYDGRMRRITVGPTWILSRFLEVGGDYQFADFRFEERGLDLRTHLVRLRVRASANTHFTVSALTQYNSVRHVLQGNLRLRYNVRDGQDFWLVLNEGLNTDRERFGEPVPLPRSDARTIVFKYAHTFTR